jgi:hypothetical protein
MLLNRETREADGLPVAGAAELAVVVVKVAPLIVAQR